MTEGLEQKAVEIIGQLQALSPEVASAAMQAAHYSAMATIITGGILVVGSLLVALAIWIAFRVSDGYADDLLSPLSVFGGIASLGMLVGGIVMLSDVISWVGIWHPEIYLAAKVLG